MSEQSAGWAIRPYAAGDEHALVGLFETVFGRPIDADFWRWKLGANASPAANVWLAVAEDRPIFQYAGIPLRFQTPSGQTTAMISVDTMTDPDFRRRGLLTSVGSHAYERWREAGVGFVLGLPNDQWGSRTNALHWDALFPLRWRIRPLRPEAIAARRLGGGSVGDPLVGGAALRSLGALGGAAWNAFWDRRLPRDPSLRVRLVERVDPAFDEVWAACRGDARLSVVRDSAWVGWRYLAAPGRDYRVLLAERQVQNAPGPAGWRGVGYVAYRLERAADGGRPLGSGGWGMIAELTAPRADPAARRALLRHAIDHLRAKGADAVAMLAVPGSTEERFAQSAGFVFGRPGQFSVQYVPLATDVPPAVFRDPAAWSLAGGDFDVI